VLGGVCCQVSNGRIVQALNEGDCIREPYYGLVISENLHDCVEGASINEEDQVYDTEKPAPLMPVPTANSRIEEDRGAVDEGLLGGQEW